MTRFVERNKGIAIASRVALVLLSLLGTMCEGADIGMYYADLEDAENPSWSSLKETLQIGENSFGPAYGSTIRVNHNTTKVGSFADREISQSLALHTPTHSYIGSRNFDKMTRWYQQDDNTEIFRLFPGDDNVRNSRANAPRSEIFSLVSWKRGDGWHEWSGRYTFLKVRPGAVFQIKHNVTYWSMQLILEESSNSTYDLSYVKLRDKSAKTLLMEDVVGKGVDIKVLDDGENHEVYVNNQLRVTNAMTDRPKSEANRARWGLYSPKSAMDCDILILVTGAYVGPQGEDSSSSQQDKNACNQRLSWLVPDILESWFASFFEYNALFGSSVDESTLQTVDAEPRPSFLSKWYGDADNEGYGYF